MRLLLVLPAPLRASLTIGRLDTESSGGMAPTSPQAPPPSFDRRRIGNAIAVDGVDSPGRVYELDCWFEEERRGWEMRVRDLEKEVQG